MISPLQIIAANAHRIADANRRVGAARRNAFTVHGSRNRRGFTLIEILCVVVIIGMASAIIVPQIASRDDLRAVAAARQLMGDLLYAQSRSIAFGKMHYVQFDTVGGTYQILDAVSPNNVITNPLTQNAYTVTVGTAALTNVSISSATFDGNTTIAFDTMGVPYSWTSAAGPVALSAGSVVFTAGRNNKTVTISPYSGQIKVQ
jgi:prepilin-type N-terminal cleavage/methylation domain-containing protein